MKPPRAPTGDEVTVEGEVVRITYESHESGFRVVKLSVTDRRDPLSVIGTFPPVGVGVRVRVRGRFENDRKHGEQLRAIAVTELLPSTLKGVERYLASGMIHGVGEAYARRIVEHFGLDTLKILDEEPEKLRQVEGVGPKRAAQIAKAWRDQKAVRDVMVFLQAHGASGALAARIYKRYGAEAVNVVSRDPYRLSLDVWGVGFKTADRIAQELGIARDAPARIQAGVLHALHDVGESGHTCALVPELAVRAAGLLGFVDAAEHRGAQGPDAANVLDADTRAQITHALGGLVLGGYVVTEDSPEGTVAFAKAAWAAETRLSERLRELVTSRARPLAGAPEAVAAFEREAKVTLAEEQREAVARAAASSVLVITGGPGVGKTTIVRAVVSVFERAHLLVRLAAPTGRAAKRLSESTSRDASTVHRLLEFDPKRAEFKRNAALPLECDVLVVDEASMIDLGMADAITQALSPGTRLVLVGDVDQLPSVGAGAVLRDVIASAAVPVVRLTRIFRQAEQSLIVRNAHRVNRGIPPETSPSQDGDFFVIDRRDAEHARDTIVELVTTRIPRRFGLDPVRDVQVLTPMHRGPAGSIALNEALQAALNPTGVEVVRGARKFRVRDKVMQLRNDYDRDVWNGDIGVIQSIVPEESKVVVRFDESRDVDYEAAELDELTLAYACSVHKAQGSEYPAVVVPLLTTHFVMLSKNLLYTAVTRGRRLVVLVEDPRALRIALAEDRRGERRTRLAWRLQC